MAEGVLPEVNDVRLPYEALARRVMDPGLAVPAAVGLVLAIGGLTVNREGTFEAVSWALIAAFWLVQTWISVRARVRLTTSHLEVVDARTRSWPWEDVRELRVNFARGSALEVVTDTGRHRLYSRTLVSLARVGHRDERRRFEAALEMVADSADVRIKVVLPLHENGRPAHQEPRTSVPKDAKRAPDV